MAMVLFDFLGECLAPLFNSLLAVLKDQSRGQHKPYPFQTTLANATKALLDCQGHEDLSRVIELLGDCAAN